MQIPFGDLKRQYFDLQERINDVTREVYESGWFILGKIEYIINTVLFAYKQIVS